MNKMSSFSRIIIAIGSLAMVASYFLPVWFIYLLAPQYPEGLTMYIWLDKLSGQVDIINGLNHYIGMKHIAADMFPELKFMVYIVGFFILFGLIIALTGKRKLLFTYLVFAVIAAIVAMYDFYQWGYDYGHNLDPKAAIQVPGLFYQPPLFGHKTLLNFDAYSYPDSGGWVIISVVVLFFIVWFFEWKKNRKTRKNISLVNKKIAQVAIAFIGFTFISCQSGPKPIVYGTDICTDCKMTIMDPKFAGEIITKKGKVFKFDDIFCIINFQKSNQVNAEDVAQTLVIDFEKNDQFIDVASSFFVISPLYKSPMNGNVATFFNKPSAEKAAVTTSGKLLDWSTIQKTEFVSN